MDINPANADIIPTTPPAETGKPEDEKNGCCNADRFEDLLKEAESQQSSGS